jgi:hypothetical protein
VTFGSSGPICGRQQQFCLASRIGYHTIMSTKDWKLTLSDGGASLDLVLGLERRCWTGNQSAACFLDIFSSLFSFEGLTLEFIFGYAGSYIVRAKREN